MWAIRPTRFWYVPQAEFSVLSPVAPTQLSPSLLQSLADDIRVRGLYNPLLVVHFPDEGLRMRIRAGHSRMAAMKSLGHQTAPVIVISDTSVPLEGAGRLDDLEHANALMRDGRIEWYGGEWIMKGYSRIEEGKLPE